MNKATRMLAVTGMTLLAGLTFGATPALAGSASATAGTTAAQAAPGADHVQDHFWSLRDCERSGRWGERRGDWDHYRCRRDWHGRGYVLLVDGGWHGDHDGHGHHHDHDGHDGPWDD